MNLWMAEGYLYDHLRFGKHFDVDEMLNVFDEWIIIFKRMAYKGEYL